MSIKKQCITSIFVLLSISLMGLTIAAHPSNYLEENAGTSENPFLISNLANLRWLSETQD